VDPAELRPRLAPDIELKEFKLRGGNDYAVIANPRDLIHYRLEPSETELVKLMDGTRTVKEIVVERFQASGDLELSGVADLVSILYEGNFLERRFVDVQGAVERALHPISVPRQKGREFMKTLTIEWQGAHRLVQWLHDHGFKWFFKRWAEVLGAVVAVVSAPRDVSAPPAVPSRPAGLLIIVLEGPGELVVDHEAHVGPVHAHPERVGGRHHGRGGAQEVLLDALPLVGGEPGMVRLGADPAPGQRAPDPLHPAAGGGVDEAGAAETPHERADRPVLRGPVAHLQDGPQEVLAVEPPDHPVGVLHPERGFDLAADPGGRGGGQREHGGAEAVPDLAQSPVGRPEVVSPHRDTVRLVHGEEAHFEAGHESREPTAAEALRGHEEETDSPALERLLRPRALRRGEAGMESGGRKPDLVGPADLVRHERDEGAHHERQAGKEEGRHLVADALPSPGGQDPDRVPSLQDGPDQLLLAGTEGGITEVSPEDRSGVRHARHVGAGRGAREWRDGTRGLWRPTGERTAPCRSSLRDAPTICKRT
jgi:hypothetical protein